MKISSGMRVTLVAIGFALGGVGFCPAASRDVSAVGSGVAAKAPDDTDRLQRLLDAGTGVVNFPEGDFVVSRPLTISSDTRLVCAPRTRVKLAPGSNCPILRNRNWDVGGTDANISVEGGLWDGNNTQQKRGPSRWYRAHGPTPGYENNPAIRNGGGDVNQLTVFAGVRNLRLRGMTLKDPDCYCIELTDVEDFVVDDITFDCNLKTPNEDGLHIDGAARNGRITNVRGTTSDDLVALNSDEGEWRSADNTIENLVIDGIYGGTNGYTAVRFLSRAANIRNVVVRNVFGEFRFNGVSFTHWAFPPRPGLARFDNIVLENIFVSCSRRAPSNVRWGTVYFQAGGDSIGSITVRNLRRTEGPDRRNGTHTVRIEKNVRIRSLLLDNVVQSLPDDRPLILKDPSAECNITLK